MPSVVQMSSSSFRRAIVISAFQLFSFSAFVAYGQDQAVSGNLTVTGDVNSGGILASQIGGTPELYLNKVGTIGWSIRNNGSFNVFNWQDSSFPLTILSNDNVGVGTSAPTSKLEVNGDIALSSNYNSIHFLSAAGPGDLFLDVEPGTRTLRTRNWNTASPNVSATSFHTGTIMAEGNVGIGTMSPVARLSVNGNAVVGPGQTGRAVNGLTVSDSNVTAYIANADIGDENRQLSIVNEAASPNEFAVISMRTNPGGGPNNVMFDQKLVDPNDGTGRLIYSIGTNGVFTDAMTLSTAGNLGIGTTTPVRPLHVASATPNAASIRIDNSAAVGGRVYELNPFITGVNNAGFEVRDVTAGTTRVAVDASGNVGIGTTAPGVALDVIGWMRSTAGLGYQTGNGVPWWVTGISNGPAMLFQENSAVGGASNRRGSLGWMDNNGVKYEYLTWSEGGNIGVGTTTPASNVKMEIETPENTWGVGLSRSGTLVGGLHTNGGVLTLQSNTGGGFIAVNSNVGIGTTAPTAKLEVNGDTKIDGNLLVSGVFSAPSYIANNGAISGGSTGLALSAGGTNQNIILTPSGTGATVMNGSLGIGTTTPNNQLTIVDPGQNAVPTDVPPTYVGAYIQRAYSTSSAAGVAIQGSTKATNGTGRLFLGNADEYDSTKIEGGAGTLTFAVRNSGGALAEAMRIQPTGYIGIGTPNPDTALTVKGRVHATEVVVDATVTAADLKVQPTVWADDVLAAGHRLEPLSQVEREIKTDGHLPGIPSAKDVAANGVSLADMQAKLLGKIEELTLHQIEQEKLMLAQRDQIAAQNKRIEHLEAENAALSGGMK